MIFPLANNSHTLGYAWTMFILTADELIFYVNWVVLLSLFLFYFYDILIMLILCAESQNILSLHIILCVTNKIFFLCLIWFLFGMNLHSEHNWTRDLWHWKACKSWRVMMCISHCFSPAVRDPSEPISGSSWLQNMTNLFIHCCCWLISGQLIKA